MTERLWLTLQLQIMYKDSAVHNVVRAQKPLVRAVLAITLNVPQLRLPTPAAPPRTRFTLPTPAEACNSLDFLSSSSRASRLIPTTTHSSQKSATRNLASCLSHASGQHPGGEREGPARTPEMKEVMYMGERRRLKPLGSRVHESRSGQLRRGGRGNNAREQGNALGAGAAATPTKTAGTPHLSQRLLNDVLACYRCSLGRTVDPAPHTKL